MTFLRRLTATIASAFTAPVSMFDALLEASSAVMFVGAVTAMIVGAPLWVALGSVAAGLVTMLLTSMSTAAVLRIAAETSVCGALFGVVTLAVNYLSLQEIGICALPLMATALLLFRRERVETSNVR